MDSVTGVSVCPTFLLYSSCLFQDCALWFLIQVINSMTVQYSHWINWCVKGLKEPQHIAMGQTKAYSLSVFLCWSCCVLTTDNALLSVLL